MTINIFVLKGELNGKNPSGAFLFLSGIYIYLNTQLGFILILRCFFCLCASVCVCVCVCVCV